MPRSPFRVEDIGDDEWDDDRVCDDCGHVLEDCVCDDGDGDEDDDEEDFDDPDPDADFQDLIATEGTRP